MGPGGRADGNIREVGLFDTPHSPRRTAVMRSATTRAGPDQAAVIKFRESLSGLDMVGCALSKPGCRDSLSGTSGRVGRHKK